jgi:hypothetical protein
MCPESFRIVPAMPGQLAGSTAGYGGFGGGVQGVEVDDPAVRGLHRGNGHERGARGHRIADALQRRLGRGL